MRLTAAASGFLLFLLSVHVVQGQDVWGVTYSATEICAVKGSTVAISCTYTYPSGRYIALSNFWFTKMSNGELVNLKLDYTGRVQYSCQHSYDYIKCTLRISDLRESDSAKYKFRFETNQEYGKFTGSPGVTLSVTGVMVHVQTHSYLSMAVLKCQGSCPLPDSSSYIWYENERIQTGRTSSTYSVFYGAADSYSCAVNGHETRRSPAVYAPKLPSVSVSPSAEIEEGSSVTLTCSSDANPAANYTWYKENEDSPKASGQNFTITDFRAEHSGSYSCEAQNKLGRSNSKLHLILAGKSTMIINIIRLTLLVVMLILLLLFYLWMRKEKDVSSTTEPKEPIETVELDSCSVYENVSDLNIRTAELTEEPDDLL
ncbi:B-cell receptor CD22-like isoform X2 [Eleginops maclovinus]|uniref:B-cell receptor CD22-like isoform X2 n=1 Tax=Eleginops maclovinus TaxID=56733 RepID=UPI0030800F12